MNKKLVRLICIILAIVMAFSILVSVIASVASAAPSQSDLDNLKTKQENIKQQMQDLESQIDSAEFEQAVTTAKKKLLDEKVELTQQEIDNISEQIVTYENLIVEKEEEVVELERQQDEQWELYKTRMRAMEENGTVSYYAIIFGASSFTDMLMRLDTINSIMEYDETVYDDLVAAQKATEEAKQSLEDTKLELEDKKVELQETEAELVAQEEEAAALLEEIENNLAEYETLLDQKTDEQNKLQQEIAEMEEEIRKASVSQVKGTGSFSWPAELLGKVNSKFGWRMHPILNVLKYHAGIDIGGLGYGANILAADGGTVITSDYSSSYGNYVTISHGNGYTTLYAHMSKRLVSKGDTITKGQIIGLVGSTGLSTGPHLHFEIWKDGSRVDPLNYFTNYVLADDAW
jgi:murein DD-endopeptidase MepM/ murein hydrolase activator NlpD